MPNGIGTGPFISDSLSKRMETLPQLERRVNLIEDSLVSDCCGAPVVRLKNEMYGCIWCGNYCCEDATESAIR